MIRAVLTQNADGSYTACSVRGHSDHAEAGYDIVCAGASTLALTCVNSLEALCGIPTETTVTACDDGVLAFSLPRDLSAAVMHDAQILLRSLQLGLAALAEQYPDDIHLSISNGGKHHD